MIVSLADSTEDPLIKHFNLIQTDQTLNSPNTVKKELDYIGNTVKKELDFIGNTVKNELDYIGNTVKKIG